MRPTLRSSWEQLHIPSALAVGPRGQLNLLSPFCSVNITFSTASSTKINRTPHRTLMWLASYLVLKCSPYLACILAALLYRWWIQVRCRPLWHDLSLSVTSA